MEISYFIQGIANKVVEVSGVKLDVSQRSTVPKEVWLSQEQLAAREKDTDLIVLRTSKQTQNLEDVELKQFDPSFQIEDHKIPCRVAQCSATKNFIHESESEGNGKMVKRDLFVCKDHREKLMNGISKYCIQKNVPVDVASLKKVDLTGYTSLIGVLEKAFMHLKSKWWKDASDCLLAEMFLNTRNFLIITNALLNPDEDNEEAVLGPYLRLLLQVIANPVMLRNGIMILRELMYMIVFIYRIMYVWIHIPVGNPGAKLGSGLAGIFAVLIAIYFWGLFRVQLAVLVFCAGLVGSALFDLLNPPRDRYQSGILQLLQTIQATPDRQLYHVSANDRGDIRLTLDVPTTTSAL